MAIVKMIHLLFLFGWMAALLATIVTQNRKIYFGIDLPCMVLALTTGLILLQFATFGSSKGWFHMKITFATLLVITDLLIGFYKVKFLNYIAIAALIGVLSSIYLVRNKEAEWKERYQKEFLAKNG